MPPPFHESNISCISPSCHRYQPRPAIACPGFILSLSLFRPLSLPTFGRNVEAAGLRVRTKNRAGSCQTAVIPSETFRLGWQTRSHAFLVLSFGSIDRGSCCHPTGTLCHLHCRAKAHSPQAKQLHDCEAIIGIQRLHCVAPFSSCVIPLIALVAPTLPKSVPSQRSRLHHRIPTLDPHPLR